MAAQTYSSLWKQVESAEKADLPADEAALLEQIGDKARKDREYGHMLKAALMEIAVKSEVEPDSFPSLVEAYEKEAGETRDAALEAVCLATLGHIYGYCYRDLGMSAEDGAAVSKEYYGRALASPELLARTRARTYEPLAENGNTPLIFGGDLLHLIAFEAGNYRVMTDYYTSSGNRPAACLASLWQLRSERPAYEEPRKSTYLARLDSLIHEYQDLEVAGEVAIEHFNVMDDSPDVSSEEKLEFIDEALLRWPSWQRMGVLRNARQRITLPSFHATIPETLSVPGKEIPVYITSVINLQSLTMNVWRVDITGDESYDPNRSDDYKALLLRRSEKPAATDSRVWYGLPEYREIRDTLSIAPLPVGVYMVEFLTDNGSVPAERTMLNITNLRLVDMSLTDKNMRLVAVDATTGKPIAGAGIHIKFRQWKDRRWQEDETVLETEGDGELVYSSTLTPYMYRITTEDDKAFPWQGISRRTWTTAAAEEKTENALRVFTDRAVYRPGQKVGVSVLAYTTYSQENWEVAADRKVHVELSGSGRGVTLEDDVTTDEWGVAAAEFVLPADAPSGSYYIRAKAEDASARPAVFRVEQYKRPTFTVELDDCNEPYGEGDTIKVRGRAVTYAGAPVVGASVRYTVRTGVYYRWLRSAGGDETIASGETAADGGGEFVIDMPAEFPSGTKKGNRLARITLSLDVTGPSGETHPAEAVFHLADRETLLGVDGLGEKQCREEDSRVAFVYVNSDGREIPGDVTYRVDSGEPSVVAAGETFALPLESLASGEHTLRAVCGTDTLERKFTVFSLEDKKAPVDTDAWYYSTCGGTRCQMKEGKTEYIQLGTTRDDQRVYYTVISSDGVLESGQMTLNNELVRRDFLYKREWGDGIAVRFTWVRDGKLYSYAESMARPVKDCSLEMGLETFRDRLTPGEKEEWTVTVRRPDGTPAAAQVMAVLYDKALDAVSAHKWSLVRNPYYKSPSVYQTASYSPGESHLYGEQPVRYASVPDLAFWHFSFPSFFERRAYYVPGAEQLLMAKSAGGAVTETAVLAASADEGDPDAGAETEGESPADSPADGEGTGEVLQTRENLDETAFFLPQIVTDKNGEAKIKFTLPESLTTWRFMSLAHDKEMNVGNYTAEMTARKKLMVQPNVPRFVREGDRAQLSASVASLGDEQLSVTAELEIADAETGQTVFSASAQCVVAAEGTSAVTFDLPPDMKAGLYECTVTASAGDVSDGERHYLPVLSSRTEVVATRAFTQTGAGEKKVDLESLYGENAEDESLSAEYTDNPAWLVAEALPSLESPETENAVSLAAALYAARLAENLEKQLPEGVTLSSGTSSVSLSDMAGKLSNLQNRDGSFSWYGGMLPSDYVTLAVAKLLARARHLGLELAGPGVLSRAMQYLDGRMAAYVEKMKKLEDDSVEVTPSAFSLDYLYTQAVGDIDLSDTGRENASWLLDRARGRSSALTVSGKANTAVIMALHPLAGDLGEAETLLESIRQYAVPGEDGCLSFDTPKAGYSWRSYGIPAQTSAIEAFQTVAPEDEETISALQQWLLEEKRATLWDSPLDAVDAVYAFFSGWRDFRDGKLSAAAGQKKISPARLYVDGRELERGTYLPGRMYTCCTAEGRFGEFSARKTGDGVSWGAVSVKYTQPAEDVTADGEMLSLRRELLDASGKEMTDYPSPGQRVKVRITVEAGRDLDFVEITDNRPACLEPVIQTSGYGAGGYSSPGDCKTVYSFDKFSKGRHVVETEYYVDRGGDYRSGTVTARCAYAPEYSARGAAYGITVK